MTHAKTSDLWWKNAVFYCVDVETFQDSDGDGVGDFAGLIERIDHLEQLGVTCLWLMPFFPTCNLDDGYDVVDYYGVDPRLGSLGDFVELVRAARDRGMRVIADLVVNHTSKEHPWFRSARADRNSPYRDWYVWREAKPEEDPKDLVFPDREDSNWEWDEVAGAYYLHRFYKNQPDLNIANPAVRDEIRKIVGFWLELGLAGFRVDAVPFLLETMGIEGGSGFAPHDWLRSLRAFLSRRRGDAILMGEVNLEPEQVRRFFGDEDGDELHLCLNFNLNQSLALAIVREDAGPLVHGLRALPSLPPECQWANFVRNHDEWSLDKLTEAERQEVFKAFGPKEEMQLFGRGLRRRLPTMLDGDQRAIRMAYSLAFSLPGTPVLFYGEEIGMAENLAIEGRYAVRAPMQWSAEPEGGFTRAERARRPPLAEGPFGYRDVNVAAQRRDPGSLLN
ncbi:MAG TPA: alpha-amylase family protein, partial [Blastocatellia bacterium]|nr:alpha-amylase family protein [Blastocatellia bacterium]